MDPSHTNRWQMPRALLKGEHELKMEVGNERIISLLLIVIPSRRSEDGFQTKSWTQLALSLYVWWSVSDGVFIGQAWTVTFSERSNSPLAYDKEIQLETMKFPFLKGCYIRKKYRNCTGNGWAVQMEMRLYYYVFPSTAYKNYMPDIRKRLLKCGNK